MVQVKTHCDSWPMIQPGRDLGVADPLQLAAGRRPEFGKAEVAIERSVPRHIGKRGERKRGESLVGGPQGNMFDESPTQPLPLEFMAHTYLMKVARSIDYLGACVTADLPFRVLGDPTPSGFDSHHKLVGAGRFRAGDLIEADIEESSPGIDFELPHRFDRGSSSWEYGKRRPRSLRFCGELGHRTSMARARPDRDWPAWSLSARMGVLLHR